MCFVVLLMAFFLRCEAGVLSSFSADSEPQKVCEQILAFADVKLGGQRSLGYQGPR